jgi:hypothetical protein
MTRHDSDPHLIHSNDKQLQCVSLDAVLEKRRLDQALNAKEFAVCAGVSYSTARSWFHLPGFPVFHGVIFWHDFVQWRMNHHAGHNPPVNPSKSDSVLATGELPPRAARILHDTH